jgi:hypothetical protein
VLTVAGGGSGIGGTSDQFRLVSQPVSGDSQTSVRVLSQNGQNLDAGLIIRQPYGTGTRPDSRFYAVVARASDAADGLPQPDVEVWTRTGEATAAWRITKWYPAGKPVSLMVQRTGNLFNAGVSFDGVNFTLVPGSTMSLDLPTTTLQGLVVDSGSSSTTGSATFSGLAAGAIATSMAPRAPAHACPQPWTCADLGNPDPPGDTTISGGTLTLTGTGGGVDAQSDSVHYVYQSVSADQALSARVTTQTTASNAEDGLMMRASPAPTAPMYSVYVKPGGVATVRWRVHDDIANDKAFTLPSVSSPAYLQIVRFVDTRPSPPVTFFTTQTSTDGTNWTVVPGSTIAIDMGSGSYLAGLMATTGTPGATTAATFSSISVAPPSVLPASACPTRYTCADLGAANAVAGSQVVQNGTWTMDASGSDIWDVFDSFRFAYQPFPLDPPNSANGDGTISARIVSQTNVGGRWMKTGVMIRAGTGGGAPYYGVFVTPSNGLAVQWRTTQAAITNSIVVPGVTAPRWALASRYTDTAHNVVYYSAYSSTDGVHFTFVPGSTVALNLAAPLIAGVASDSYDSKMVSRAVFDSVAQIAGSPPPPFLCPSAWSCTDIGGALPPGQDQLTSGTWNETGGGGDIWANSDAFHFVSQPVSADATVSARVTSQQPTDPWAKAGVMLRATTDPGSPYYAAFVTPGNGVAVQWRTAKGAATSGLTIAGAVPVYLRVARYTSGSSSYYTAYTSSDGATWTPVPGSTLALNMPGALLGGFAITSHNQGVASAVTLDSVTIAAGAPAPPNICPAGWSCVDVGGATPAGGQTLSSGTWTIQGGGGDIWSVADSYHWIWQSLAGDGSISASVSSQTNSDPWAKAGVMLRATTDPGSPYYAAFVTPGNGVAVQWRTAQGATTNNVGIAGTTPVFLRVTRTGTTYTAAISSDGITWTTVAGSAMSLPNLTGSLMRGLAVTSHNTGLASTVVMTSVVTTP